MRAIIVGAGVGGLASALALLKEGIEPIVVEQAPSIKPVGAGLNVFANGLRVLDYLEVSSRVRAVGVVGQEEAYYDLIDGGRIARRQLLGPSMARRYGDYHIAMHRADLVAALLKKLPPEHLSLNSRVVSITQNDKGVTAMLADGRQLNGDVLIGADGLRSKIRGMLFGEVEPRFTGQASFRTLIPLEYVPHLPLVRGLCAWAGDDRVASCYPIRRDLLYFGAFMPEVTEHPESWTTSGGVQSLRKAFAGACEAVRTTIDVIEAKGITPFVTGIFYRDPIPTWSVNRVTLVGDAAHPAPPAAGQGAGMALEDSITLAKSLKRFGSANIGLAFKEYEARRIPRTRQMLSTSRRLTAFRTDDPARMRAISNTRIRNLEKLDPLGEATFGILAAFDPVKAATEETVDLEAAAGIPTNTLRRPQARKAFEKWSAAFAPEDHSQEWVTQRPAFEKFLQRELSSDAAADSLSCNGIAVLRVGRGAGVRVLHLHGGLFSFGSARGSGDVAARIAEAVNGPVYVPEYRLAPEHPFPSALNDIVAVYDWLVQNDPSPIVISGECAGGGLAISLAVALRNAGKRMPEAIFIVSPFCDLALTGKSIDENGLRDPLLNRGLLTQVAASYLGDSERSNPLVSPLLASLKGLPPLFVYAASAEALRDDAIRLAEVADEDGVDVRLRIVNDSVHSFVLFDFLPETQEALGDLRSFARSIVEGGARLAALQLAALDLQSEELKAEAPGR